MDPEQKLIADILGDQFTRKIVTELGLQNEPADVQVELVSKVGETVMGRVVIELAKALPEAERGTFENFIGSSDLVRMREFLLKHIPNLDEFIRGHAQKEYDIIKSGMRG